MGSIFKQPKIKAQPPPELPDEDAAREAAERELEERRRKRAGRSGTILSSAMASEQSPTILTKKLLGG